MDVQENAKRLQGTERKKQQALMIFGIVAVALIVLMGVWKTIRWNSKLSGYTQGAPLAKESYSEEEKAWISMSLSFLVYGCERETDLSGTVSQILEERHLGIVEENFGLIRQVADDPATAPFDTAEFIRRYVGDYRFLTDLKDSGSGFYGSAFCDDERRCVWITYSGSVETADTFACIGLVLVPGLSTQEKEALKLYEQVMQSSEVTEDGYEVVLAGHSLGGALATLVAGVSGCNAVTVNGADGIMVDKLADLLVKPADWSRVTNYLTSPNNGKVLGMDIVQRLILLGSYRAVDYKTFQQNDISTDSHAIFSFLEFEDEDYAKPIIPEEK